MPNVDAVSPDTWGHVQPLLDRDGNQEIQLQMFYSYGSNPPLYPEWQEYLREYQPPTLIVWGENDEIFPAAGAEPYKRDLENLEYHLLDTGHFALETHGQEIADLMRDFLQREVIASAAEPLARANMRITGNNGWPLMQQPSGAFSSRTRRWRINLQKSCLPTALKPPRNTRFA